MASRVSSAAISTTTAFTRLLFSRVAVTVAACKTENKTSFNKLKKKGSVFGIHANLKFEPCFWTVNFFRKRKVTTAFTAVRSWLVGPKLAAILVRQKQPCDIHDVHYFHAVLKIKSDHCRSD